MKARERALKQRCAKFGAIISRLELRALTKRQRQVAEMRGGTELAGYREAARREQRARPADRGAVADAGVPRAKIVAPIRLKETSR